MMEKGRGYVVDVSDFLKTKEDSKWKDLERHILHFICLSFINCLSLLKIPYFMLNIVRRSYRRYKKLKKEIQIVKKDYILIIEPIANERTVHIRDVRS